MDTEFIIKKLREAGSYPLQGIGELVLLPHEDDKRCPVSGRLLSGSDATVIFRPSRALLEALKSDT